MVPCHGVAQHSISDDYSLQGIVSKEYRNIFISFCSSKQLVPSDQVDMLV